MSILDLLRDPQLFGGLPDFRNLSTWGRWVVFLKAVYGLPLDASEGKIFRDHTGRSPDAIPPDGWREVVCIVGRQSGKSRVASLIATYEAVTATPKGDGTELYALMIAQDFRGALRTLFSYARAPFETVPILSQSVRTQTADTLRLDNGAVLAAYPCRPAAVRGLRARVVVCDELAFFRSSENLPQDAEMLRAVRPTLATTGGRLIILSSPYGQSGALWDLHRTHFGRDDSPVLIWQGSAPDMNPCLPKDYLDRMAQDDPDAYRSEVLGEFRAGVATFLDPDAVTKCVDEGVRERLPVAGLRYRAFCDPSGGRRDRFAVAIAHHDGERVVLDAIRAWSPPFNPSGVIAEAANLLRSYQVSQIEGDRYSGEFVVEQFRTHGVSYSASERDRSTLYLELLPHVNAERVVFLDQPELLRELRGLERRRGASGRDRVDHGPRGYDDRANAVAGVVVEVASHTARPSGVIVSSFTKSIADVSQAKLNPHMVRNPKGGWEYYYDPRVS